MAALVAPPLLLLASGQAGLLQGHAPDDLGVRQGRLKPPSETRNSVSSQADLHPGHPQQEHARVEPWPWPDDDPVRAMQLLADVLSGEPSLRVVRRADDYIHAEARTRWLGFVDDLEFWSDPDNRVIQVRSASRLGREDFGANRRRMEQLRTRYMAAAGGG
ncbi:MAG: DUF1499 domain-containing protein [Burkholderiales bacterium]|nr:MAG: DUF1499 domain-containing protein [Burkholderiales bacterium]